MRTRVLISYLCAFFSILTSQFVIPAGAAAATPRDELLRFVPEDVAFCLVLQDLRVHAADLLASPFAEQLRRSPLGPALADAREVQNLRRVEDQLRKCLGVDWTRLRDDVLGEAVVFAYRPGPPGKPEQDEGLGLVRARDARALAEVIERLNRVQKESGELRELEARTHDGLTYYRRVDRKEPLYYFLRGPVLVFSGQEALLRRALARERTAPADAEPPVAARLRELGMGQALLTLWLNPRAFDAAIEAKLATASGANAAVLKTFAGYWKALDSVGASATVAKQLTLAVALRGRPERLPPAARRFLTEAVRPSDLWRAFPEQALLAVAGRCDVPALFEMLGDFLTPPSRQKLEAELNRGPGAALGRDFVKEVLPAVGPDWGLCLTAPADPARGWFPQAVVAVRVGPGGEEPPVDQALLSALNSAALLVVLGHNRQHPDRPLSLKTALQDRCEVKYLAGERCFPPGLQPAFALRNGYLVLASSPEALRRFGRGNAPGGSPPVAGVPLLRVSFKDWRGYLTEHREALARNSAEKHGVSKDVQLQKLDRLLQALQLFDRLELRQCTAPGQVTWALTVQTALPLRK